MKTPATSCTIAKERVIQCAVFLGQEMGRREASTSFGAPVKSWTLARWIVRTLAGLRPQPRPTPWLRSSTSDTPIHLSCPRGARPLTTTRRVFQEIVFPSEGFTPLRSL